MALKLPIKTVKIRDTYDVLVYRDGDKYYAEDNTGKLLYLSTDSEALLQYVLNNADDGDVIYIKDVVYADTLISKKRVILTGPGAIYTKTGKLVRLLGNIEVKDLEVDFYTPRTFKQPFIEQFTDPNLSAWLKYMPSDGSIQVYQDVKTVSFATFIERGVTITGSSSDMSAIYKTFPLTYKKHRIIFQVVDLTTPTADKILFALAIPGTTRPFSGRLLLKINTAGNLTIVYVNTNNSTTTIDTGVNIASKPIMIALDTDISNNYVKVYVGGKEVTITDFNAGTDLKYIVLIGDISYTAKFNLVYVEQIEGNSISATTVGSPDPYHPVGISDYLNVYALGLKYTDGSTHIEIRDLKSDYLINTIDLDETLTSDGHEYVYTRFVDEGGKIYLYAILSRHVNNYTIYKIDTNTWNIVWKKGGNVATYCKLIWSWVTGLAVLYRDSNYNIAVDHINPSDGSIVDTDVIVSAPSGYMVYGFFSPDWSGDGYLWLAWSNYENASGLRKNVYVLAIDKNGNAYAPDGSKVTLPVSSTDDKLLIEQSNYSQPVVRPVREGAVVFRGGFYTPDTPSAFWLKKPGQVIKLELPAMPYVGLVPMLVGRAPAIFTLTYVSRLINNVLYNENVYTTPLPIDIKQPYIVTFVPAKSSKLLTSSSNKLYIYNIGYRAQHDGEIII